MRRREVVPRSSMKRGGGKRASEWSVRASGAYLPRVVMSGEVPPASRIASFCLVSRERERLHRAYSCASTYLEGAEGVKLSVG